MGINRIDHASVYVGDLGKALTWYEDVLGLTVLSQRCKELEQSSDQASNNSTDELQQLLQASLEALRQQSG